MKKVLVPALVLIALLIGYGTFILCTVSFLPPRLATHFDIAGRPNGWMNRSTAAVLLGVIGWILPLMVAVVFGAIGFLPTRRSNMTHRDHWLSSDRREETRIYVARQGLWLASLMVGLQAMVWYQLIESNRTNPPRLSLSHFVLALALFGAGLVVWIFRFYRHFAKAG